MSDNDTRLKYVAALLARDDAHGDSLARLREAYPHAPTFALEALAFHACCDGVDAMVAALVGIERFLRGEVNQFDKDATIFHALYHFYNILALQRLLATDGRQIADAVRDAEVSLNEPLDLEGARAGVARALEALSGKLSPPSVP